MDIKAYITDKVVSAIGDADYDIRKLTEGIGVYSEYNYTKDFKALITNMIKGSYDYPESVIDAVIKDVVDEGLQPLLSVSQKKIILYFSNYRLIEDVRVCGNAILELAKARADSGTTDIEALARCEQDLKGYLAEVYKEDGLYDMLKDSIKGTMMDIDFAKGITKSMSQRLSDLTAIPGRDV